MDMTELKQAMALEQQTHQQAVHSDVVLTTDPLLLLFIVAWSALSFMHPWVTEMPPMAMIKAAHRREHKGWFHMPRLRTVATWNFLSNVCLTISATYFSYQSRSPVDVISQRYYVAITSLLYTLCMTKMFWQYFTFNQFSYNMGIGISIFLACFNLAVIISLIVLFAIRDSWVSFGFMFGVLIYHAIGLGWNSEIAHWHWRGPSCNCMCDQEWEEVSTTTPVEVVERRSRHHTYVLREYPDAQNK